MTLSAKVGVVPVVPSLVHVRSGAAGEQIALLGDTAAISHCSAVEKQDVSVLTSLPEARDILSSSRLAEGSFILEVFCR